MAERKELLEIHKLLHSRSEECQPDQQLVNQMSDLELLREIVKRVKQMNISSQDSSQDSLAFPTNVRKTIDLSDANELWGQLEAFNDNLKQDYTCRRQMLLQRLDCTVESFKWKGTTASKPDKVRHEPRSGAGLATNDQIHELYNGVRMSIKEEPQISLANLLSIREKDCDKLLNGVVGSKRVDCKINYGSKRQQQSANLEQVNLKQVIIPNVPDRGGRTDEIRPPVKESFGSQRGGFRHNRGPRR